MRTSLLSLLACACLAVACPGRATAAADGAAAEPPFWLGGIQVNEDDHTRWARALHDGGMNTVAVTVYAKQGDWDSANLWYEDAPSVISEMRAARAAGLHVVLILRVALDHAFPRNQHLWHGQIMPRTDDDVREWFRRYRDFVSLWADIASREGVSLFGVGSEMNTLTSTRPVDGVPDLYGWWLDEAKQAARRAEVAQVNPAALAELEGSQRAHRVWAEGVSCGASVVGDPARVEMINARRRLLEEQWLTLLVEARAHFRGPLTYAANFDQFHDVALWQKLDVIGINAYFKLRPADLSLQGAALDRALQAGWRDVLDDIDGVRRAEALADKPVVFTELGYTRRRGSTIEPWNAGGFSIIGDDAGARMLQWDAQREALKERASAVRALGRAAQKRPGLLRGALYWKLSTKPSHADIEPFVLIMGAGDPLQRALVELAPRARR